MHPANRFFIDGKDFWNIFSIFVESGSEDFLRYPSAKKTITRDWADANGLDVDVSAFYFNARDITLNCAMLTDTPEEFHTKYESFIVQWLKPGLHRVEVAEHGLRSYFCIYKETPAYERFSRIQIGNKIATKFSITITELEPVLNNNNVFIVTQDNRFLVT